MCLRMFVCCVLFTFTVAFLDAEDDVQIIRSDKSVLSIYSYGAAARTRVAPEVPESNRNKRSAGALTDVTANPPLSSSVRNRSNASPSGQAGSIMVATPAQANSSVTKTSRTNTVRTAEAAPTGFSLSSRTVSIGWQPSVDSGVVGYRVYAADATHEYALIQTVGNETSATVPVGDNVIYLAVSAFTDLGFESPLSDALTVGAINPLGASSAAGLGRSGD
jgi:hypothetical protein